MTGRLKAWAHSASVWLNAMLLAAFPFADSIMQAIDENLPGLAQYLPPNVYKVVGVSVVMFNLVRAAQRAHRAAIANGAAQ